jgi:hypothetical protein
LWFIVSDKYNKKGIIGTILRTALFPKTNVLKMGILLIGQLSSSPDDEPNPRFNLGNEPNHIRVEESGENKKIYLNDNFATNLREDSLMD